MMPFLIVCASTLSLWGYYVSRAAPTITIGDSGELAAVGATLGIGHSPGYPLFSILTSLGTKALPWATAAYRVNVQSAFWTAACVGLLCWGLWQLTRSLSAVLLMGLVIGLGPLWMNQAMVSEVFSLNCFIASVLIVLAIPPHTLSNAGLSAYLLGFGMGNHHTLILLAPALLFIYWPILHTQPAKAAGYLFFLFLIGLTIYLFIPIRAHQFPVMNWEEPVTWMRFWKLITRARYGSFQLAQGSLPAISGADVFMQIRYVLSVMRENQGPWCVLSMLALLAVRRQERRRLVLFLAVAFVVSGPFFFLWTHLHVTPRTRAILDRFMYLPLVPAGLWLGLGIDETLRYLKKAIPSSAAVMVISMAGLGWAYAQALPFERNNYYVRDFGKDLIRSVPIGTLLFADRADEAEFSLAYLQRIEKRRQDITFIDCNAGVSRSIYGPGYYDVWGLPRLAIRTTEERARIRAWEGPVYYATHEPDMIPIPRVQEGLVYRVAVQPLWRPRIPWHEILMFRRPIPTRNHPTSTDRGMFWDYWSLLYQDSVKTHAGK
jgi:hypothetical protein